MAITTIRATIQMRRGLEEDLDENRLVAGEWAVSTDKKYIRMCFAPGVVMRMATYESFEQDMAEIREILLTCQGIQEAVEAFEQLAEQHKDAAAESDASASQSKADAESAKADAETAATSAETSKDAAAVSATNAAASATAAAQSKADAETAATSAETSKDAAAVSATNAAASALTAQSAKADAESARDAAIVARTDIETARDSAEQSALTAQSWAVGTGGVRTDEATNNAKYYAEQARDISGGNFITTSEKGNAGGVASLDGSGKVPKDQLPSDIGSVTGVKGNAEAEYRTGEVNLTAANIGAVTTETYNDGMAGKGDNISYDEENKKLQLKSGEAVLSEFVLPVGYIVEPDINLNGRTGYLTITGGKGIDFRMEGSHLISEVL